MSSFKKAFLLCLGILISLPLFLFVWGFFIEPTVEIGHIEIRDRFGVLIAEKWWKDGYSEPYTGSLDTALIRGIIQVEDSRFFSHHGTDILAKVATLFERIRYGSGRGGSTLTEQYVKNMYFPSAPRSFFQKFREMIQAQVIEIRDDKETILRHYLDTVYMGNGIYGIEEAMREYFRKEKSEDLTPSEISEIITRIHSPNLRGDAIWYRDRVGKKLFGSGGVSAFTQIERRPHTDTNPLFTERILQERTDFCQWKENQLDIFLTEIPKNICQSTHLTISTTIDRAISESAARILEGVIVPLQKENIKNAAILIWDNRHQKVIAYIGNRSNIGGENAIDMITQRRSVGSVLKPFLYGLAFDRGYDGESLVLDDTRIYETDDSTKKYIPENYVPKSYGPISLREALGNSLNSAAVRLSESLGIGAVYDQYMKNGLDLDHDAGYYGYGIALGSVELTLENIVRGYDHLTDLKTPTNFLLFQILSEWVNRSRTFGISSILNTSLPMAVKTGTSTDFRDNWAVGYNGEITIGVWVGNADGSSMEDVSGVSGAGPIFHQIAEMLIERWLIHDLHAEIPEGIESLYQCRDVGCFQKEHTYVRQWLEHKSRPYDSIFYESDFVHRITSEEKESWKVK